MKNKNIIIKTTIGVFNYKEDYPIKNNTPNVGKGIIMSFMQTGLFVYKITKFRKNNRSLQQNQLLNTKSIYQIVF